MGKSFYETGADERGEPVNNTPDATYKVKFWNWISGNWADVAAWSWWYHRQAEDFARFRSLAVVPGAKYAIFNKSWKEPMAIYRNGGRLDVNKDKPVPVETEVPIEYQAAFVRLDWVVSADGTNQLRDGKLSFENGLFKIKLKCGDEVLLWPDRLLSALETLRDNDA